MTFADAAQILHLALPTTANAVRTAYRRISRLEHPDMSKHPQAAARFCRLTEAYELLKTPLNSTADVIEDAVAACDDGTPLTDLGKGLADPLANSTNCAACGGKGYTKYTDPPRRVTCCHCRSAFFKYTSCQKCGGTGRFVLRGRDKGICFDCQGKGVKVCGACGGKGYTATPAQTFYHRCNDCEGCGEIRIWNPVLPKGLLIGGTT